MGGAGGGADDTAELGLAKSPSMRSTASSESAGSSSQRGRGGADTGRGWTCQSGLPGGAATCEGRLRSPTVPVVRAKNETSPRSPEEKNDSKAREKQEVEEDEEGQLEKGMEGKGSGLGMFQFSVDYDAEKTALIVSVIRARDLPAKDVNVGSSDPYVKLQLLPDKRQKVSSCTVCVVVFLQFIQGRKPRGIWGTVPPQI